MRILMVTPEVTPFGQTGGLGEVMASLPAELVSMGLEVDVLMPKYRGINPDHFHVEKMPHVVEVCLNDKPINGGLWKFDDARGVRYLFLENDRYYNREHLYGAPAGDYEDNSERFVFLARAAIQLGLMSGRGYDVFHAHDWQAALIPVYLRTLYAGEPDLQRAASVMTIHNLGFQGIFWHLDMPLVGLGWEHFNPREMEFYGKLNFLKSGIVFADEVNTVSTGYRNEILTPEFGCGLEGVLAEKGDRLSGILNGVDYTLWNPAIDPNIPAPYSTEDLSGKAVCKAQLQKAAGLPVRAQTPVIAMVSRLSHQKGMDIVEEALPELVQHDLQLVLLGSGDPRFHASFMETARLHPDKIAVFLTYSQGMAHQIFAGSDMLLVPSRYEPCGINQLYGLKYGTVPIVRTTGGLNDTVEQFNHLNGTGTGFKFINPLPSALQQALFEAVRVYTDSPETWATLVKRGMMEDFSWLRSAKAYKRLYERAMAFRKDVVLDGRAL